MIGLGATLTTDVWSLFIKHIFKITSPNYCLVGRWLRYMPEGIVWHPNIVSASRKSAECSVGWIAHYVIGIVFAITFSAFVNDSWFLRPTMMPAICFGLGTVLMPFFIMQPAFGLGWAASRTPNPVQARLRSLMTHAAFGVGLYLFALFTNWLI
jgi:hypothetical protein